MLERDQRRLLRRPPRETIVPDPLPVRPSVTPRRPRPLMPLAGNQRIVALDVVRVCEGLIDAAIEAPRSLLTQ